MCFEQGDQSSCYICLLLGSNDKTLPDLATVQNLYQVEDSV